MLTLDNFDKQISQTILERGKNYFDDELVAEFEEANENVWNATVFGSEEYSVAVILNSKNAITKYRCDCPFDGDICKHVVAVCYAIREQKKTAAAPKTSAKNSFKDVLKKLSLAECTAFIQEYSSENEHFKTAFELYFADKNSSFDVEKQYSDLIRNLVKKHTQYGFVDYKATRALAAEFKKLMGNTEKLMDKGNFKDAFSLIKVILKNQLNVLTCCDDSSGAFVGSMYQSVNMLEEIMMSDSIAFELKMQIFDYLEEQLNNRELFNYGDFGYDLIALFSECAIETNQPKRFIKFIDTQISAQKDTSHSRYYSDFLKKTKIEFLTETGN